MTSLTKKQDSRPDEQRNVLLKRAVSATVCLSLACHASAVFAQASTPSNTEPPVSTTQVLSTETIALPQASAVQTMPPEGSPVASTVTATSSVSAGLTPTISATLAPYPLKVVYSHIGADQSEVKPVMDNLRVIHAIAVQKGVAAQVALNVAMLLLGGGMGFTTVSKDNLTGREPAEVKDMSRLKNPALVQLVQEMQRQSVDWLASSSKTNTLAFTKPLVISSAAWKLVFNSHSADDKTYQLKFNADVYKIRDKKSFFSNPSSTGESCYYESKARPLEEWMANDYQAVVDLAPVAVAQCAKEFTAQLPNLLDLK